MVGGTTPPTASRYFVKASYQWLSLQGPMAGTTRFQCFHSLLSLEEDSSISFNHIPDNAI